MTNELHLVLPATVIILGAVNSCSKKKTHVVMGKKKSQSKPSYSF